MAQQIALHIHYQNAINIKGIENVDRSFICHYSSHLLLHENDTCSHLLNMKPLVIQADSNYKLQQPISYANILNKLQEYNYKVSCIIIECPHREIGGKCTSFQELQQISQLCRSNHIALHMDGARLWEALAYYTTTINPLTNENVTISDLCNLFDSIYVSCYKGIGGITGAVLLGDADFMIQARIWLRRYGGNVYTLLPYAVSSYAAYRNYVSWNLTNTTSKSESSGSSTTSADVNSSKLITTSSMESAENNLSASNNTLSIPYSMKSRLIRLKEIVAVLSNNTLLQEYIYFDPPIPHVCLIHVYIKTTIEKARIAHNKSRSSSGIGCFAVLRPRELYPEECYFEFNLVGDLVYVCIVCILYV